MYDIYLGNIEIGDEVELLDEDEAQLQWESRGNSDEIPFGYSIIMNDAAHSIGKITNINPNVRQGGVHVLEVLFENDRLNHGWSFNSAMFTKIKNREEHMFWLKVNASSR